MSFLAPIAGLIAGAIGGAAVLLLYMLRLRRRPVRVSSTLLWRRAVRDMEGNVPWQRLSPSLLLLLHLLIVLLLALALARPVREDAVGRNDLVYLVIDASASMNAVGDDGESGFDRAKALAIERSRSLFESGRSARVTVVEAGLEPRVVLSDSRERGRVIGAIRGLGSSDQPGTLAEAIGLVQTTHEARQARGEEVSQGEDGDEQGQPSEIGEAVVWAFTDGGSVSGEFIAMRAGGGVTVPVFDAGDELWNMGVVALGAQRDRADPALCRVFVRVGRSVPGPGAGAVRVFEGDQLVATAAVSFEEDDASSATHTFELRLMREALLRVELGGEDALGSDDRAWVRVPAPDPVRLTVIAPEGVADPLLVDFLEVIARAPVRVVGEDGDVGTPQLIVYDRVSPEALPGLPTIGFSSVLPGRGRVLDALGERSRAIWWDRADPAMQDAGIGSVSYQRAVDFGQSSGDSAPGTRVLASDADGALIIEQVQGGGRHLRVAFALHDSNWPIQFGLTAFLVNAIEQLLPGAAGVGEVCSTRDVITSQGPDGQAARVGPFASVGEQTIGDDPARVVGVSLLDGDETSLRISGPVAIGSGRVSSSGALGGGARLDLWRWFALGAIALIVFEWFVYARRISVG